MSCLPYPNFLRRWQAVFFTAILQRLRMECGNILTAKHLAEMGKYCAFAEVSKRRHSCACRYISLNTQQYYTAGQEYFDWR
jgi:hypothetical protein